MNLQGYNVLLVEDNPGDARLLREAVRETGNVALRLQHVDRLKKALDLLTVEHFDVVLLDLSLPDGEGLDTLTRTLSTAPGAAVVVLTGLDDEALALRAVRDGAQDYLVKGQVDGNVLMRAMRYATERKRSIEALQRSEEYFRSLIENALDIIIIVDDSGTIRYSSPAVQRVLGYRPDDITGRNLFSFLHPGDEAEVQGQFQRVRQQPGSREAVECRVLHLDGSWRVLEASATNLMTRTEVGGIVVNARDVTERKQAEEALREANETLKTVIETSPLAIYTLDLFGRVRTWNKAAERIFGWTEADVKNHLLPIIAESDLPAFHQRMGRLQRGEMMVGVEASRLKRDGNLVDVSIWSAPLRDARSTVTGVVVCVADTTEKKRLEEQFRQAQKMEAVGRLAGGVAHDFNNLLTVITGYCQMLYERFEDEDPSKEELEQVLKAADRATVLTKKLLAFSRRQIVQPKVIDLNHLLSEMEELLRRLIGEDVELRIERDPQLGRVQADPGQLEQVIVNLAVNARDAMPNGGVLVIGTENAELGPEYAARYDSVQPGPHVMLRVTDTGCGMDAETQSHIFEPFFTTKAKGKGTGLGLSTSYGIVKQNNGEIMLDSEPNLGSTFRIYLPEFRQEEPAPVVAHVADVPPRGSETILIVEDEEGVRRVMHEMLNRQGYNVLSAHNSQEAINVCQQHTGFLHLLLTDVIMPSMSGRELADRLRLLRPEMKVLYVSGYTDSAIVHHGVLDAGTAFLQKPFTPDALSAKIREVLAEG